MADSIPFPHKLSPSVKLSADASISAAKQALAEQGADFVIVKGPVVQGIVSAEYFQNDRSADTSSLATLTELPPVVSLAADWQDLSAGQVENLYQALEMTGAHGILVYDNDKILGVLSATTLETGLTGGVVRVSKGGLEGTSSVSFRIYSCQDCGSMRIPSTGEETPPICPKDSSHGSMALE